MMVAPWFLEGATAASRGNGGLMGLGVILLSLRLGRLRDHYGTYDPVVLWSPRSKARERHGKRRWGPRPIAPAH